MVSDVTKIFGVDAETNGLYGPVWAVGAVAFDPATQAVTATFRGQLSVDVVTDDWTRRNVVPVVDLPRYKSAGELLEAFWTFWEAHGGRGDVEAVADVQTPVEAGLFRACVQRDRARREFAGPYPLHELASALWMAGLDPHLDRREFCGRPDLVAHDPVADAMVAALCWSKLAAMRPASTGPFC